MLIRYVWDNTFIFQEQHVRMNNNNNNNTPALVHALPFPRVMTYSYITF